jgi:hypothetical protein
MTPIVAAAFLRHASQAGQGVGLRRLRHGGTVERAKSGLPNNAILRLARLQGRDR